jgi:lysozyme
MNEGLSYSKRGLLFTENEEGGFREKAYQDQGGVWTVAWGHTGHDVTPNTVVTREQGEILLAHDLETAENFVKRVVKVPLAQDEFDANVDLTFNIGVGNFLKSTVLRLLNAGNKSGAAKAFEMWNKVSGKVNKGLVRRRLAEEELFLHGVVSLEAA